MATVATAVIHRMVNFRDGHGDAKLFPSPIPQVIPGRMVSHPYLLACIASGWVTDLAMFDEDGTPVSAADSVPEPNTKQHAKEHKAKRGRG